jgi:hypothetical protein
VPGVGGGSSTRAARLRRLVAVCAVVLLLDLLLLAVLPHERLLDGPDLPWLLLAGLFFVGDSVGLDVELRRRTFVFHLSEVQLLLGLALCPLPEVIAARFLGGLLEQVMHRRPLRKIAGNAVVQALEVLTAAALLHLLTVGPPLGTPATWAAVPFALLGSCLVGYGLVHVLVLVSSGVRVLDADTRRTLLPWSLCIVAESVVGLLLLDLLDRPVAAGALVALGVGFGLYHRSAVRLRGRYSRLEILSHFTEALVGQVDTDDVVGTVLEQSLEVLRGDTAELLLLGDEVGPARWVRHTARTG